MSTVSLVIPVHNRWPLVERTLASIEAQTRYPDHLIIVDNGSGPDVALCLKDVAERLGSKMQVTLISCPTHGAPAARNAGLELADTDWTMFFDSDDIMLPDHIARAMDCAEANPEANIVGWDCVFVDAKDNILRHKRFPSDHYLYHAIMHGSLATQCYMARTSLFRKTGGWNPEARIWNDMELSVRLLMQNPTIVKTQSTEPGVRILTHADSITGSNFSSGAVERDHTLDVIASYSGKKIVPILALKRTILAACCSCEHRCDIGQALYHKALGMQVSPIQRIALRFAYHYTSLSLPGAARLVKPFIYK